MVTIYSVTALLYHMIKFPLVMILNCLKLSMLRTFTIAILNYPYFFFYLYQFKICTESYFTFHLYMLYRHLQH